MAEEAGTTIVIKRIKKGGHGAHGGAWKVAYADFVTAMMAFFLLLWLLSTTTDEQKAGIAEFFTPTVGIKDEEGIGFKGGESHVKDGTKKDSLTPVGIVFGAPTTGPLNKNSEVFQEDLLDDEAKIFETMVEMTRDAVEEDEILEHYNENILVEETPEGLKISIIDKDRLSMFKAGTAELLPHAKEILARVTKIIVPMPQRLAINGHTDSTSTGNPSYTNWELSADRANASRRFMKESGLDEGRFEKVVGLSDQEPLDPRNPTAPVNRRLTIILLKHSTMHDRVPGMNQLLVPPRINTEEKLEVKPKKESGEHLEPVMPIYPDKMKLPVKSKDRKF